LSNPKDGVFIGAALMAIKRSRHVKILMVLASHDVLGSTGRKTGFWLEEFAAPYFVFRDAGIELTLYSSGKPIALVCHSPGVLRHVTYKGEPLVKGKRVTGFTNGEEAGVELTKDDAAASTVAAAFAFRRAGKRGM
jgi:putative intracellular protease/amidase